jgi:hypothetical protein
MRSYLQVLTAALFALAVSLAGIMSVVCLMMGWHLDLRPGLREEWPLLLTFTGLFVFLSLVTGAAWWSLRRRWQGWPAVQGLMWISLVFFALLTERLLLT